MLLVPDIHEVFCEWSRTPRCPQGLGALGPTSSISLKYCLVLPVSLLGALVSAQLGLAAGVTWAAVLLLCEFEGPFTMWFLFFSFF